MIPHWLLRGRERGQVLLFAALVVPVLLGMTGIAIDVGTYADDKRNTQNAADAIALAAAQDLCSPNPADCSNTTTALATANAYALKNDVDPASMTVTFQNIAVTPTGNPQVRVAITHPHTFAFVRIVGVNSKDVSVSAAAIKTSPGGVAQVSPWSVTSVPPPGTTVTFKFDASGGCQALAPGNCGAIAIDGNGSSTYQATIQEGSKSTICAQGQTSCTNTSPVCPAYDVCNTEPGNLIGGTRAGVNFLLATTAPACNTFAAVFGTPDAYGKYTLNGNCNPWAGPGQCPKPDTSPPAICSRRVIIIPVLAGPIGNGKSSQTITSFALFWLDGFGGGGCTGNNCTVQGVFVKADVTVNALTGLYNANSSIHFVRLSE